MLSLLSGRQGIEQDIIIKSQFKITKIFREANIIYAAHQNITLLIDAEKNFLDIKTKDGSITIFHAEVEPTPSLYGAFDIDRDSFILINTHKLSAWLKNSSIQQTADGKTTCYEFMFCSEQQILPAFHNALKEVKVMMPKKITAYQILLAAIA